MTYLAEEVIRGTFFKFIHNGDASPRCFSDLKADDVAQFLSFTQHIQYIQTSGQVYISDYQGPSYPNLSTKIRYPDILIGSTTLLTDPQILTSVSHEHHM